MLINERFQLRIYFQKLAIYGKETTSKLKEYFLLYKEYNRTILCLGGDHNNVTIKNTQFYDTKKRNFVDILHEFNLHLTNG